MCLLSQRGRSFDHGPELASQAPFLPAFVFILCSPCVLLRQAKGQALTPYISQDQPGSEGLTGATQRCLHSLYFLALKNRLGVTLSGRDCLGFAVINSGQGCGFVHIAA